MYARTCPSGQKLYDKNKIGDGNKNMFLSQWKLILQKKAQKLHCILQKPSVFGSNPEEEDRHVTADTIPSASV